MKKFSVLIWIGLVINILMLTAAWYFSSEAKEFYDELSYSDRNFIDVVSILAILFFISIVVQVVSLLLLSRMPKTGLTLAILSSIVMLPFSIIFMAGYSFSYEKHRNKSLIILSRHDAPTLDVQLNFDFGRMAMLGLVYLIAGAVIALLGMGTGWLVTVLGVFSLCNAFRMKNYVMIGLLQDKLAITPNQFSETYLVPLSDVTLIKENKSLFKLHIKSASVDRKCTFRKSLIKQDNYQITLEDILSKIAK